MNAYISAIAPFLDRSYSFKVLIAASIIKNAFRKVIAF